MAEKNLSAHIAGLGRRVFSARELCAVSGRSPSAVSQGLAYLAGQGLVVKVAHGVWAAGAAAPSPYEIISYLLPRQRAYVSFTSALHLHGIIEQIPQMVTLASVAHSARRRTASGMLVIHHVAPYFFAGYAWREGGAYLLAEPEKALVDCLYVSAFRKRQFSHFPELRFSKEFSFKKALTWVDSIKNARAAVHARSRLRQIAATAERVE